MSRPSFRLRPTDVDPATVLYVDGVEPGYRSLSHWPGNTTPTSLKRETSTEIVLAWAALPPDERDRLVGPFQVVSNNHFDTDGALSVFAAIRPEEALPHRESALKAAATGDFAVWRGPEALAVDLTVAHLPRHPSSPLAGALPDQADDDARWEASYLWLIENLGTVLSDPFRYDAAWGDRHAQITADVATVDAGRGPRVERFVNEDLAVVELDAPITALALHHAVRSLYRVLVVHPGRGGSRYRLFLRDESWFDLGRPDAPRRPALEPLRARLADMEPALHGAWWTTALAVPVAQLGFGQPGAGPGAFFEDVDLADEPASALPRDDVVAAVRASFAEDDA